MSRALDTAKSQQSNSGPTPPFVAGKNKIINGDFGIWQRGTSFTGSVFSKQYMADRYYMYMAGTGTPAFSVTQQTFTGGAAPVNGYEGKHYMRVACTNIGSSTLSTADLWQPIEDVRTFAGQQVTFSFWARSSANTSILTRYSQFFGSGGSAENFVDALSTISVTTSWQRYSVTFTPTSFSGKTVGDASNALFVGIKFPTSSTFQVDIWGLQLESGSTATPFQTATGTIQGELAACQRYYARIFSNGSDQTTLSVGASTYSTTNATVQFYLPVTMRTKPTSVDFANLSFLTLAGGQPGVTSMSINNGGTQICECIAATNSSFTSGQYVFIRGNTLGQAYVGFSAEL
jgi:hypothetical protein